MIAGIWNSTFFEPNISRFWWPIGDHQLKYHLPRSTDRLLFSKTAIPPNANMPKRGGKKARRTSKLQCERAPHNEMSSQSTHTDRCHRLDWTQISGSRQNFIDSTCILSMLSPQQRGDGIDDGDPYDGLGHEGLKSGDDDDDDGDDFNDDDDELADAEGAIWDIGRKEMNSKERQKLAEAILRNRFLDRLSEVLARAKRPPLAVKVIASAYMAESIDQHGSQQVQIIVAKNEGLNGQDDEYLRHLVDTLMQVSQNAQGQEANSTLETARNCLLMETIAYARPRIDFYLQILTTEFNREPRGQTPEKSDIGRHLESSFALKCQTKYKDDFWECYPIQRNDNNASQSKARAQDDHHSSRGEEESFEELTQSIKSIIRKILHFCSHPSTQPEEALLELMKETYLLQTDIRSRMVFRACFIDHFGLALGGAMRAQRALLFLCRYYGAISTFVAAATQIPSFRNISIRLAKSFDAIRVANASKKTVRAALIALSTEHSLASIHQRLGGDSDRIDRDFNAKRHTVRHVHAEMQLLEDLEILRWEQTEGLPVHPYIGGSKLCCYLCDRFLRHHGFFHYRGCHWKVYHKWLIPPSYRSNRCAEVFGKTLRLVYEEINDHIRRIMSGEESPSKEALRPDSTLDLSTAATISSQDSSDMVLKSPFSQWRGKGYVSPNLRPNRRYRTC